MTTYLVTIAVREPPVLGAITRLRLPSSNVSEKARLEDIVGRAVGGSATLMRDRYVNDVRLFSRDEIELELKVESPFPQAETLRRVSDAVVQYWGGYVGVFSRKIEAVNPVTELVGQVDFKGAFSAFAGAFVLGAILGVIVRIFRG